MEEAEQLEGAGDGDSQDEARRGPSRHADQHGQPGVDIQNQGRWEEAEQLFRCR